MGLSDRIGKLFGRSGSGSATLITDQARAQKIHGRETGQTASQQDGTRERMVAELDAQRASRSAPAAAAEALCPHTVLVPRWDNVADIGHDERATGFTCEGCGQVFTADAGHALRQTETERVRAHLAE
jgi:hypothetical protein